MAFREWRAEEEGWIEWCIELVDYHMEHLEKPGHHPDVQNPTEFQYYVSRYGMVSNYGQRTQEELTRDVNVLHDFTRKLVQEKNLMQRSLTKAEEKVKWAGYKIWLLTIALSSEGAVIAWLAHEFFARFH